jgi:predicted metal-dependent peptidase
MMREHRALDDIFPGKKRDLGFEIIIAIDTSGSISGTDFNDFMNQIYKISKDCNVIKVRVIQCHTRITDDRYCRISSLKALKEFQIKEYGGTAMRPIFEKLKGEKNRIPLILFTDGEIDSFSAEEYTGFKHIIFLSRGHEGMKPFLERNGFKVICQDHERKEQ